MPLEIKVLRQGDEAVLADVDPDVFDDPIDPRAARGFERKGYPFSRMTIRALRDDDAEAYVELRREALEEAPLAFAASPASDFVASPEAVREQLRRAPEWVILGAFEERLAGAVGLFRDRHPKSSHKAHLWGMYVTPAHRRQGIAAGLLHAALRHARSLPGLAWVQLSVSSAAPEARRLYERAGFEVWGIEPDALRHGGESAVEHHMVLRLETQ